MSNLKGLKLQLSLVLVLCCFLLSGFSTSQAADHLMTEAQLVTLESNFTMLAQDYDTLKNLQAQSDKYLMIAQEKLSESQKATQTLQQQLAGLKAETNQLQQSLSETDSSLKKAEKYLEQSERKQSKLERQNKLLKYLLIGVGVYATTRR